jgi:hypothetical protein
VPLTLSWDRYPANTTLQYIAPSSWSMPGSALGTVADSTLTGIRYRRLTTDDTYRNRYPSDQPWNADGTRLRLDGLANRRLLHGTTYADLGSITASYDLMLWANTNAAIGYVFRHGAGLVQSWAHATDTSTTLRDFTSTHADQPVAYASIDTGYDGTVSTDDHLLGFVGVRSGGTSWDVIAYDPIDDRIEAIMNLAYAPSSVKVSYTGTYVVVMSASAGANVYSMSARVGTTPGSMTLVRNLSAGQPHGVLAVDASGNDVFVLAGGLGTSIRLSDGASTTLVTANQTLSNGYSSFAQGRPGWVYWGSEYVDSAGEETEVGYGQMLAVKLDGSGTTQIFGFNRNMITGSGGAGLSYYKRPFATPNRDGKVVLFGSDAHGGGAYSGTVHTLVCGMAA